ncbi:MAG: cupin domain-containing protein [Acidimicrobiales bacterium]
MDDDVRTARRPAARIDDGAIDWRRFRGYDGLYYWVLGANPERQKVDLYFRLLPGARCPPHRHVGPTDTLVVEGEHRIWDQRGDTWVIDQIRPAGTFAISEGDNFHSEQGGEEGAIVLLSMTAVDGVIWETFDEAGALVATSTVDDFARALDRQRTLA